MRLLRITQVYEEYAQIFEIRNKDIHSYEGLVSRLNQDAFAWPNAWTEALGYYQYQACEIMYNIGCIQRAWARGNNIKDWENIKLESIVLQQIKQFKPDILWVNTEDFRLVKEILEENPSIRLVLGWVGSALQNSEDYRNIDVMLSCAPEAVERLKLKGVKAYHLDHAFNPSILESLTTERDKEDLIFIGQIIRSNEFHLEREKILLDICRHYKIKIFSPQYYITSKDLMKQIIKKAIYKGVEAGNNIGIQKDLFNGIPHMKNITRLDHMPDLPVNLKLKKYMSKPVFGMDMFNAIRESKIVLNIHADSSPRFASNMRLFETTGVGSCLLTDWRPNMQELFELDKEVVTYKSADECVEKVKWLLEHPKEREKIAQAGQKRTLKEHTFIHRAERLNQIIQAELKLRQ